MKTINQNGRDQEEHLIEGRELGAERTDGSEQAEYSERAEFRHETAAFVDQNGSHLQLM